MAYFCYGKKGICDSNGEDCGPDCASFNGEGGYDTEIGRELTSDIIYVFDTLGSFIKFEPLNEEFQKVFNNLKKEFGYDA